MNVSTDNLKKYEVSLSRVEKAADFIQSLELIIKDYKNDKDAYFRVWANMLDNIKQEIEENISEDVDIVDKYEQEEHEDEVRCINEHEF